jgi:hypothetical protein
MCFFTGIIQLLAEQSNKYYHQYLDSHEGGLSLLPEMTDSEMFSFLGIIIQVGHDIRDKMRDYWATAEQFITYFYSNTLKRGRFLHILLFLHFTNNNAKIDKQADNYDRLWRIRTNFESLSDGYEKYYNHPEHLAVEEIIVKFSESTFPKKQTFRNQNFKLCDAAGYTKDTKVCLGKERTRAQQHVTAKQATVRDLCRKIECVVHELYMDNLFSTSDFFEELTMKKIICCCTVTPSRRGLQQDLRSGRFGIKKGDIRVRVRGHMTILA